MPAREEQNSGEPNQLRETHVLCEDFSPFRQDSSYRMLWHSHDIDTSVKFLKQNVLTYSNEEELF